jgi:hypothetical protein
MDIESKVLIAGNDFEVIPVFMNQRFEVAGFFFPKTPGAVVCFLLVFIEKKDFFILEIARVDYTDEEAEGGASGSEKDNIVRVRVGHSAIVEILFVEVRFVEVPSS